MDPELCLDPELGKFKVGSGKNNFWIRNAKEKTLKIKKKGSSGDYLND